MKVLLPSETSLTIYLSKKRILGQLAPEDESADILRKVVKYLLILKEYFELTDPEN